MIRKSIEPGTKVFNEIYRFGIFKQWTKYGDPIVEFENDIVALLRKDLTEVEDEIFNPFV